MIANKYRICTLLLVFSCMGLSGQAQKVINSGKLFISKETSLTISGTSFNNDNTGEIVNEGEIILSDDWDNNSPIDNYTGDGTIRMNGVKDQNFEGEQIVNTLIFENSEKTLSGKTIVSKSFIYDQIVNIKSDQDIFAIGKGASPIKGNKYLYINGPLYHEGKGVNKFYPIGNRENSIGYAPIYTRIQDASDDLLLGFEALIDQKLTNNKVDSIRAISTDLLWKKRIAKGSLSSAKVLLEDASVSDLTFSPALSEIISEEDLVVVEADKSKKFYSLGATKEGNLLESENDISTNIVSYYTYGIKGKVLILRIPTAFTTQAAINDPIDFENRFFKFYGGSNIREKDFYINIVDRSGNIVFKSESFQEMKEIGWNGKINNTGEEVASGAYDYIVIGKYIDGSRLERRGIVHIIR